jgi:hypothetical protein
MQLEGERPLGNSSGLREPEIPSGIAIFGFSPDATTMNGVGEMSKDGGPWGPDLALTYNTNDYASRTNSRISMTIITEWSQHAR